MYDHVHGSAPDIAGKGIAKPIGEQFLSGCYDVALFFSTQKNAARCIERQ